MSAEKLWWISYVKAVIESVFGWVVIFRTCSFLRNWNRRSGSPPTAENAENSAFCLELAQEQLLSCVNRLTQGVNRLTLLCILNNCCFVCVNRLTQGVNRLTLLKIARKRVLCCVNRLTQGVNRLTLLEKWKIDIGILWTYLMIGLYWCMI